VTGEFLSQRLGTHWQPPPREEGETLEEWLEACRTAYVVLPDGKITTPALYTRSTSHDESPQAGRPQPARPRAPRTVVKRPPPVPPKKTRVPPDWVCASVGCRTPKSPHKARGLCCACFRRTIRAEAQGISLEEYDRRAANRLIETCIQPGCRLVIRNRRLQVCKWHAEKLRQGKETT